MSDLFGNHIVGFPTRRLICNEDMLAQCMSGQNMQWCLDDCTQFKKQSEIKIKDL